MTITTCLQNTKIITLISLLLFLLPAAAMSQGVLPDDPAQGGKGVQTGSGGLMPYQGPPQVNRDFAICDAYGSQNIPDCDYNRGTDHFLVAWADRRTGASSNFDVYALAMRNGVSSQLKEFQVNGKTKMFSDCVQLGVGANHSNGEFLVCWGTQYGEVIGQFVNNKGRVGNEMVLMTGLTAATSIDVEYCSMFGLNAHYLVVVGGGAGLYAVSVSPLGVILTTNVLSNHGGSQPDIAYNHKADETLVIWRRPIGGGFEGDIYGRMVDGNGVPTGGEIAVSTGFYDQWIPSLTYNALGDCYLAVWEDLRNLHITTTAEIWGQLIDSNGTLIGVNEQIIVPDTSVFARWPAVAANSNGNYLLTWTVQPVSLHQELKGVQLDSSLNKLTNEFTVPASQVGDSMWPALVFNPKSYYFLCAWVDTRNADYDIYGKYMKGTF